MGEGLIQLINEFCYGHLLEIGSATPDKWIDILSKKRLDTFYLQYEDFPELQFKTKKARKEFEQYFKDEFIRQMTEYRAKLIKAKSEEEREAARNKQVKRKPQLEPKKKRK